MSSYYAVPVEQCVGTDEEILRSLKLCRICKKLPFKQVIDKNDDSLIYCEICAFENKIQMKFRNHEPMVLNKLILNCKEFCGKKFNYYQRSELEEHEYSCLKKADESKNFCKRCKNFLEINHDCIVSLNQKIEIFQKDLTNLMDKFDTKFQNILKGNLELQLEIKRLNEKLHSKNSFEKTEKKVINENIFEEIKVNIITNQKEENHIKEIEEKKINFEDLQNQNENKFEKKILNQIEQPILINLPNEPIAGQNNALKSIENQRIIKNEEPVIQGKLLENCSIIQNLYTSNDSTDDIIFGLIYNKIYLITASKNIRIYDLENYIQLDSIENAHKGYINTLLIINKTHKLVSAGYDSLIKFWNMNHLSEIEEMRLSNTSEVLSIQQYNDNTIITAGFDKKIRFFDISKNIMTKTLGGHTDYIYRLLIIKDSETLVSGSQDHKVKVWKNGKIFKDCKNIHDERIECLLQLEFDRNILVSGDRNGNIALWDIKKEFTLIRKIKGTQYNNSQGINNLTIYELKKRNLLITASSLSVIAFWDLKSWKVLKSVKLEFGLNWLVPVLDEEKLIINIRRTDLVVWG